MTEESLADALQKCKQKPDIITSAKTGDKVEELFLGLGEMML